MKILVACEESQAVAKAFRNLGHEAYSCDILDCSGGRPDIHIKGDVKAVLDGNCTFTTCDGAEHTVNYWDMLIAFPPCTHLAVSGARYFDAKRADGRQEEAIKFFAMFLHNKCEKIAIENPIGIISGDYITKHFPILAKWYGLPKKPTQIIQPYYFGDAFEKSTCLWLKGLEPLKPTNIVEPEPRVVFESGKSMPKWYSDAFRLSKEERARVRSKTFPGIAEAMAAQWGGGEH